MYTTEQYAQLALQMSEAMQVTKVKQFMIDELQKQNSQLLKLLDQHGIEIPTKEQ